MHNTGMLLRQPIGIIDEFRVSAFKSPARCLPGMRGWEVSIDDLRKYIDENGRAHLVGPPMDPLRTINYLQARPERVMSGPLFRSTMVCIEKETHD